MTGDIDIRKTGATGRITLNRPAALNAVTYPMVLAIEAALDGWADDDDVRMVVIDAIGDKAFSAGGDIQDMYDRGRAGDFAYGRKFWRDEYRMNYKLAKFPKPYAAFMQGFTMGGGVGVSCHGSHRVVCENSRIAMPECGIGLVPDVGGSLLLARAPGRLGEYLGTTAARMGPGDAIFAGFADYYIPRAAWPDLIMQLEQSGDWTAIDAAAEAVPEAGLTPLLPEIDAHFAGETLGDILRSLRSADTEFARQSLAALGRSAPLSAACTVEMMHRLRATEDIARALELEYRFTFRSFDTGDFVEGIRAAIIDKDRQPRWSHASVDEVTSMDVSRMLMPLGKDALKLETPS